MFGFLGPNGAGKTTAVKLLLGLTRPTAGGGTVLGAPLGDLATRRAHRLPPGAVPLPGVAHGPRGARAPREPRRPRARRAATPRSSGSSRSSASRTGQATGRRGFSKGMQQRLGLATALLGDPALVILDEPTSALDPVGRDDVRAIIREAQARGSAVLLNSHLLGEVERLCDRVAIVQPGPGRGGGLADRPAGRDGRAAAGHRPAGRRRRCSTASGRSSATARAGSIVRGVAGRPRPGARRRGRRGGRPGPRRRSRPPLARGPVPRPRPGAEARERAAGARRRRPDAPRDGPAARPVGAPRPRRRQRRPRGVGDRAPRDRSPARMASARSRSGSASARS